MILAAMKPARSKWLSAASSESGMTAKATAILKRSAGCPSESPAPPKLGCVSRGYPANSRYKARPWQPSAYARPVRACQSRCAQVRVEDPIGE